MLQDIKKAFIIAGVSVIVMSIVCVLTRNYMDTMCPGKVVVDKNTNEFICIQEYLDGGNECITSLDCSGRCYVQEEGEKPRCEYDDNPNKCRGTLNSPPKC